MSLILTRTQNLRSSSHIDQFNLNLTQYGAFQCFKVGTDSPMSMLTPELKEKAISSIGSTLQTPVMKVNNITIGNTRSVTINDAQGTSAMFDFDFTTYSFEFTIVPSDHHNNEISIQREFNRLLLERIYALAELLDEDCLDSLDTYKSQLLADPLLYDFTGNVISADWNQADQFMGDLKPMMASNKFYGPLHVVGTNGVQSLLNRLQEKGKFNESNKTMQYADKEFYLTNQLANANGIFATGYAVHEGATGLLFRVEREALVDRTMPDGTEWHLDTLPILNIPVGTYFYVSKDDQSSRTGAASADNTRAMKEHYAWSVDVCRVVAYNQDLAAYANPILAFNIARP